MASLLNRLIFDAVYDSRTLSLLLCTLGITDQSGGQPLVPDDITCEVEAELSRLQSIATHTMNITNKECKMIYLGSLHWLH